MTRSLYMIGAPGVGKSTVMGHILDGWDIGPYVRFTQREMFGHWMFHPELGGGAYMGHLRPGGYPGTDALSLSVAPQALTWLCGLPESTSWVFGEGARLSHLGFFTELHARTELTVVHLVASPEVALERRLERGGKLLSEKYVTVAASKAANAAQACELAGMRVLTVASEGDPRDVARRCLA